MNTLLEGGQRLNAALSSAMIRITPRRIIAWDRASRFVASSRNVEESAGQG